MRPKGVLGRRGKIIKTFTWTQNGGEIDRESWKKKKEVKGCWGSGMGAICHILKNKTQLHKNTRPVQKREGWSSSAKVIWVTAPGPSGGEGNGVRRSWGKGIGQENQIGGGGGGM